MNNNALSHLNIPAIQEDELFSGYLDRLCVLNHLSVSELRAVITNNTPVTPSMFANDAATIINAAEQKMSAEEVYKQNTPYRILRFVIPKVEQETIFSTLRENKRIINEFENLHRVPLYCPACIEEDIKATGSAWQHIYHNCGNVKACCKHYCRLVPGLDAARNAQIETADEETIAYAEWLYKLFRIEGVDACREKTSQLAFKALSERFPDVYNNKSSGDLRILQAAYNRFKSYTLRDADFLRLTFLLWNDRFDEFCEKYPR